MESIRFHTLLFEDSGIKLKVFHATNAKRGGEFIVKQYLCSHTDEVDLLLKESVRQAHDAYPLWVALADVCFQKIPKERRKFTVNLIYLKQVQDLPREFVQKNDRQGTNFPGLSAYKLGTKLYERRETGLCIYEATHISTSVSVVVKMYVTHWNAIRYNPILKEAIVQAHSIHEHNTKLLDIACSPVNSHFRICLVMERLSRDVAQDIKTRKEHHQPYSERELLWFLKHVTAGLIEAKKKVSAT